MKRRFFLKKSVFGLGSLGLLAGLYSWQIEPFWLEFVHIKMPIKNLPKHLNGKILMQISDMHVGNEFDYNFLIESFKKAKKYKPDFVVYTGDFISYENDLQFKQLNTVCKHAVLGKYGTVGVLGNHDYGYNWQEKEVADAVTKILNNNHISVLRNQTKNLNGLQFIGIDDYLGTQFNPKKALSFYDSKKASIALCHNPDVCDLKVWNNFKGWILSGHTHGGQFKPPFLTPPVLPVENKRYTSGKIDLYDGRTLYINRAIGNILQLRFNVRPEITIFKLENVI